jgi:ectoine hydroxylase-related dioxygenase (phytanoyl-CoA dioxygenase family)
MRTIRIRHPASERPTLRQLEEAGFAIIPDVLPPATVDNLIHAIEIALGNRTDSSEYAIRHLHQKVPAVRRLANGAMVRALVNSVLGPDAFVVRSIFIDKTPEANWKVAWHQDLTIAVRERIEVPGFAAWSIKDALVHVQPPVSVLERMVTLRLHLDNCGLENAPLQVIPMSHKSGRVMGEQISACRAGGKPIACVVPRGGALLMRPLLLHASSPATAPMHRRVVHLEFACDPLPGGLEWEARV